MLIEAKPSLEHHVSELSHTKQ